MKNTMNDAPARHIQEFVEGCRRIAAYGLVRCSSGNVSYRIDSGHMLIKVSRVWLAEMTGDDVAVCRVSDGKTLNGKTPSVEVGFHAGILRTRPDIGVVLHFQTPFATTLACTRHDKIDYSVIPEVPYYIGPVVEIPYMSPGSSDLATSVSAAMQKHDLIQLRNHGQVTVGRDFKHVIQNAVFFELACEIIVRGQDRVHSLESGDIARLRLAAGA